MAKNMWTVQIMDTGQEQEGKDDDVQVVAPNEPFELKFLNALLRRLKHRIKDGKEILNKLLNNENIDDQRDLAVEKLELAAETFSSHIKELNTTGKLQSCNRLDEYINLQMEAEDLILTLKKRNVGKKKEEEPTQKSNPFITSRLPKLDLFKFDGNILKWYEYWGRFKSSVDSRQDLSDETKLNYLVGSLEKEAKDAVAGLDIIDSNYRVAVDTLNDLYGKQSRIVDAHFKALNDIKPATIDTKDCRRVLLEIERNLRVLSSMGENVDDNNNLRHLILGKFPPMILYDLNIIMRSQEYTTKNIRKSLSEIISAKESAQGPGGMDAPGEKSKHFTTEALLATTSSEKRPSTEQHRDFREKRPRLEGFYRKRTYDERTANNQRDEHHNKTSNRPTFPTQYQNKRLRYNCPFCDGEHFPRNCQKYVTPEDRRSKLVGRCFICLSRNHLARECPRKTFRCQLCRRTGHHQSLCLQVTTTETKSIEKGNEKVTTAFSQSQGGTVLQTASAIVMNESLNKTATARILFDTGSQKSYITSTLAEKLGLPSLEDSCLTVYAFGQTEPNVIDSHLVRAQVMTPAEDTIGVHLHAVPTITGLVPSFFQLKEDIKLAYPHLKMADDYKHDCMTDILIGSDHYHSFFTGKRKQVKNNLFLIESKLGWILSGCPDNRCQDPLSVLTYVQAGLYKENQLYIVPDPPLLDDNIRDLWELESIGINDSPKIMEHDDIVKFYNDTTIFQDSRYHVKWPWVQFPKDLPINYGMAFGRLSGLIKRIDLTTLQQYDKVIKDQLSKGVIEIVEDSVLPKTHAVHYLPHHCVIQDTKTTKLRIVYDASAKSKGKCSLNEYLYRGPLMIEDLVSLLLGFRNNPIGITADIEKAFLQVGLQSEDRDVTRFLWVKNIEKEVTDDNILHLRFCRVPFGIISSPYLLAATIRHHLSKKKSKEANIIAQSLYVDNLVTAVSSVREGQQLYNEAIGAFKDLSMNIRDWYTNSNELRSMFAEESRGTASVTTTVLGLEWNMVEDTLKLAVNPSVFNREISSKREILRIVASVFDPCGFAAPYLLPSRLLLQELWSEKFKWDTKLTEEKLKQWEQCVLPLQFIPKLEIPRYYFGNSNSNTKTRNIKEELHCFTDASKDAYAAVVYVRRVSDITTVNLVMSRTKLTPLRSRDQMTIPKLELLGVLIGTRLLTHIRQKLNMNSAPTFLWTDSQIVLRWMVSGKLLEPFVSRRINEIKGVPSVKYNYVSSAENPADLATRVQYSTLPHLWFRGPPFLHLPRERWPTKSNIFHESDHAKIRETEGTTSLTLSTEPVDYRPEDIQSTEGDPFSTNDGENSTSSLASKDSHNTTIKKLQAEFFPKEVQGQATHLTNSLGLFIDEKGLLRCNGRLQNADLPYDQKFPILLPKANPFTRDIIHKLHVDNHHVGENQTLVLFRKKYWVPQGRSQVAQALKKCKECVKYGGGPYKLPPMPPLPKERVQWCQPFLFTGLDYLGPLTIHEDGIPQKRWCCLFTCMATRALRLEVVKGLSADEFLLCLRRFVALQGSPALIVSDNATQFKLAAEVLQSSLCQDNKIAWHFIPELAPWHGGFYERLVGLVKHCLRRTLDKHLVSDSQLITILKEIETVLNSRPLTPVGENFDHVLTPADFLPSSNTHPLTARGEEIEGHVTATKSELIEGWKRGQRILDDFKTIFQDQYLGSLRERTQLLHKQPRILAKAAPKIGDVVQLKDDRSKTTNRAHWRVGRIVTLVPGADGEVRTARVELEPGTTLTRSIAHLYPLELELDDRHQQDETTDPPNGTQLPTNSDNEEFTQHASPSQDGISQNIDPIEPQDPTTPSLEDVSAPRSTSMADPSRQPRNTKTAALKKIRQWTQALISLMTV